MEYLVTDLPADRLRMLGRSGSTADGFTCDYSATGVILSLSCEQDQTEVALTFLTDADVYFTVFDDICAFIFYFFLDTVIKFTDDWHKLWNSLVHKV